MWAWELWRIHRLLLDDLLLPSSRLLISSEIPEQETFISRLQDPFVESCLCCRFQHTQRLAGSGVSTFGARSPLASILIITPSPSNPPVLNVCRRLPAADARKFRCRPLFLGSSPTRASTWLLTYTLCTSPPRALAQETPAGPTTRLSSVLLAVPRLCVFCRKPSRSRHWLFARRQNVALVRKRSS